MCELPTSLHILKDLYESFAPGLSHIQQKMLLKSNVKILFLLKIAFNQVKYADLRNVYEFHLFFDGSYYQKDGESATLLLSLHSFLQLCCFYRFYMKADNAHLLFPHL